MKRSIPVFAFCLFASVSPAADAGPATVRREAAVLLHAVHADAIRRLGFSAATNLAAAGRFAPAAADSWNRTFADGPQDGPALRLPAVLVEDFFEGASVRMGPCDAHGAVFAFDNPFWDALLFVKTGGGDLPLPGDGESDSADPAGPVAAWENLLEEEPPAANGKPFSRKRVPVVEAFVWIDGDSFRGGPPAGADPADPFSVALWRIESANAARFRELHPDPASPAGAGRAVLFAPAVSAVDGAAAARALRVRAGRRAAEIGSLLEKPARLAAASRAAAMLRAGTPTDLVRHFPAPDDRPFRATLSVLPVSARTGFAVYGSRVGADGFQGIFVNRDKPRLFATVSFPIAKENEPVRFEWYDLAAADRLLEVRREGLEVSR